MSTSERSHLASEDLQVVPVAESAADYATLLALILSGVAAPSAQLTAQLNNLRALAERGSVRLDLLFGVYDRGRLISGALGLVSPGRTAIVYLPPSQADDRWRMATSAALAHLVAAAADERLAILQSLISCRDDVGARILSDGGFTYLTELVYLDSPSGSVGGAVDGVAGVRLLTYSAARRPVFLSGLRCSYEQTQDCPALAGLRDASDVLAGHLSTGLFDPEGWYVAMDGEEAVGVVLTAPVVGRSALEVVYLGVGKSWRGRGLGQHLLGTVFERARAMGLQEVTLAVDAVNVPARRLYSRWSFAEISRRRAWIHVVGG